MKVEREGFLPLRVLSELILVALREIAGSGKADGIRYFCHRLLGGLQQMAGPGEAGLAQHLDGRMTRQSFHLPIKLHTGKADFIADPLYIELAVTEIFLDDLAQLGHESLVSFVRKPVKTFGSITVREQLAEFLPALDEVVYA